MIFIGNIEYIPFIFIRRYNMSSTDHHQPENEREATSNEKVDSPNLELYESEQQRQSHRLCMHYVQLLEQRERDAQREAAIRRVRQILTNAALN